MEVVDSTKIVIHRIQKLEPESAMKLIGYLLLRYTDQEIMEFAFGPDHQILSLISEAKAYLNLSHKSSISSPMQSLLDQQLHHMSSSPTVPLPFPSPSSFRGPAPLLDPHPPSDQMPISHNLGFPPSSYADLIGGLYDQAELLSLKSQLHHFHNSYFPEATPATDLGSRTNMRLRPGWLESLPRACHYYYKGYCKNGFNCRFFHGQAIPDAFSAIHSPNVNEFGNEDPVFAPESLQKLEFEIIELLKSKQGMPVSIASLPTMYLEKYGKMLQADGYLTESQRHGKGGLSLTRLLSRLNNSIRIIDRPHGQHSVVLAEDAPKYAEYWSERIDHGAVIASSHQIYLTFPAESTFTEEDVFNYFDQYGPVHDVRIPRQEKRMFGFVSFLYPETVKIILAKGHPHYICGARVLVKPYKEKSKFTDKKYAEKMGPPVYFPSQCSTLDQNPDASRCNHQMRQLSEDYDLAIELERRRLLDLQLTAKQPKPQSYFNYGTEELKVPDDDLDHHSTIPKGGSTADHIARQTCDDYSNRNSDHIELPDSPFASHLGSGVSAII
ncbi:zinc finger CCCH domain-containing protein [Musa troglodytarum]|uniref:Zinc finger CCCH domain-containing protein n=1 Tax=Musa troglodytarum TaxID=320322 RepID=A0A9E7JD55_9LILI|nr:zinc finger CCCH domain-containing protein [Musa troglodytarum]